MLGMYTKGLIFDTFQLVFDVYDSRYDWRMYRYPLFWATWFLFVIAHTLVSYTLYLHGKNGEKRRFLEPIAVAGNDLTVSKYELWTVYERRTLPLTVQFEFFVAFIKQSIRHEATI